MLYPRPAVGGTSLSADPATGAYRGETMWGGTSRPSKWHRGGATSLSFARPAYQNGVTGVGSQRAVPDVSADATAPRAWRSWP